MEIAICAIGAVGLTWPRWMVMVKTVEEMGFAGLYCADHLTVPWPPDLDSLEPLTSMTWAAGATSRIELGTLISPFSFRDPVMLARVAKDIDALSGGRFILGMGAGWMEREHRMFGYPLEATQRERADRMEEGVRLVHALLRNEAPVTMRGKYFSVEEAVLLPRSPVLGSPRLLVGGNGEKRTLPLAAQFADEWNSNSVPPQRFRELNEKLDTQLDAIGRERGAVKRSATSNLLVDAQQEAYICALIPGFSLDEASQSGWIMGTEEEIRQRIGDFAAAGAQRLMLQVFDMTRVDYIEKFARIIEPLGR